MILMKISRNRLRLLNAGLLACVILLFGMGLVSTSRNGSSHAPKESNISSKVAQPNQSALMKLNQNYGHIPLYFEPNEGQFDPQVKFLSRGSGYSLFITPAEAVFVLKHSEPKDFSNKGGRLGRKFPIPNSSFLITKTSHPTVPPDVLRLRLENGNRLAEFEGMEKAVGKSNYFIGNDSSKWHTNIPNYTKVKMKDVYPGVDMVYYGNQRKLEYDFEVKPGADPSAINLSYEGAKNAEVDGQGNLIFHMEKGDVAFKAPVAYQKKMKNGEWTIENEKIEGRYSLKADGKIGFKIGNYDKTLPLVIDPQLDYSTYLGGNIENEGSGIVVNGSGNAYVTGWSMGDFPTTSGAFQTALDGGMDAFVAEISADGSALVYATYLGGSGGAQGNGIALDGSGNAYVVGSAGANFPTTNGAYQPAYQSLYSQLNAFVTKLNTSGSALVYSTYLGGSGESNQGDVGTGVAVDGSGNAYVSGHTFSPNFPTTGGAYQTALGVSGDIFITKLNASGSNLIYSTLLGANGGGVCNGIAVDGSGNAYVTGWVDDIDYPITSGAYQTDFGGGGIDAFLTEFNATGSSLVYSTYLGGSEDTLGNGIAVDSSGNAYVTGYTGEGFPTNSGAFQTAYGGNTDVFVVKLNPAGDGASDLIYSTYLGGNGDDQGNAIAVDGLGDAYVTGFTNSTDFPTTSGAFQTSFQTSAGDIHGNTNAFMTELNPSGSFLIYSSYLGGSGDVYGGDLANGIALDGLGNVYVTGETESSDFPTTNGAFQTSNGGASVDGFVTKFDVSDFYTPTPWPTGVPTYTFTSTPTLAFTPTPTSTPTPTMTNTPTYTSGVLTFTPTNTPTSTATNTSTKTTTPTITLTPTITPTDTPPPSPDPTWTVTTSPTFTPTNTSINTSTRTMTPTTTPTPTRKATCTNTPTSTATPTCTVGVIPATNTPTPTATRTSTVTGVVISLSYPNPVKGAGPVSINVQGPPGTNFICDVFTTAFRKVASATWLVSGNGTLSWDLKDMDGTPVADGLYYLRVNAVAGGTTTVKILKVLVIR